MVTFICVIASKCLHYTEFHTSIVNFSNPFTTLFNAMVGNSTIFTIPNLKHFARGDRDTVFLLFIVALIIIPQTPHLPVWCVTLSLLVVALRLFQTIKRLSSLPRLFTFALLIICLGLTYIQFKTFIGRDAGVTLITLLLSLKTLELKERRDALVIFFLGFFCLFAHFLFSQSIVTALFVLLSFWALLTALINAHKQVGTPTLISSARTALNLSLLGLPVMLMLFMFFPRLPPFWSIPNSETTAKTGLSNQMQVGNVAQLAQDTSVALRVQFKGQAPKMQDIYFRGPVLSMVQGKQWQQDPSLTGFNSDNKQIAIENAATDFNHIRGQGQAYEYEITLEPSHLQWLLTLEASVQAPKLDNHTLYNTKQLQWISTSPISELVRYQSKSYATYQYGDTAFTSAVRKQLQLSARDNPRTQAYAFDLLSKIDPQLRQRFTDATQWHKFIQSSNFQGLDAQKTNTLHQMVMQELTQNGYVYTLEPELYGEHTADEFWFDKKSGFCEHIASSYAILMRAAGVPARVVTGYLGAEKNALDDYWVVRQSDAHAWAEIWMIGLGWQRVDPTGAVAPNRLTSSIRLQPQQKNAIDNITSTLGNALGRTSPKVLANLRAGWDALNHRWNQTVLNYTQSKQMDLLKNFGFNQPNWLHLAYIFIALIVAACLSILSWSFYRKHHVDPWHKLLQKAQSRIVSPAKQSQNPSSFHKKSMHNDTLTKGENFIKREHYTPRQLANLIRDKFPNAQAIEQWLIAMEQLRYKTPHRVMKNKPFRRKMNMFSKPYDSSYQKQLRHLKRQFSQLPWPKNKF